MRLKLSANYWYEPDFKNNKELPEKERIKVLIKKPTVAERDELTEIETSRVFKKDKSEHDEVELTFKRRQDTKRILEDYVLDIKNLTVEVDGAEREVKTGSELASLPGLSVLSELICAEVLRDEVAEQEKNSE